MPKQAGSIAQFFKSERSGEDMYEISHRIGKGSYGAFRHRRASRRLLCSARHGRHMVGSRPTRLPPR